MISRLLNNTLKVILNIHTSPGKDVPAKTQLSISTRFRRASCIWKYVSYIECRRWWMSGSSNIPTSQLIGMMYTVWHSDAIRRHISGLILARAMGTQSYCLDNCRLVIRAKIHLKAISQGALMNLLRNIYLEITLFKFYYILCIRVIIIKIGQS